MQLEENIKGICSKHGLDPIAFLADLDVDHVNELSIYDLQAIAEEYEIDLYALLFKPLFKTNALVQKLEKIKLLVLDVDGVMTDGGMYFSDLGDEIKRFNTKDGMAIMRLTSSNFQVAIISSGFKEKIVKQRAEMLKIQHCYVTREKKMEVLTSILNELNLQMENVAMIGDDINDLEVMQKIGFAVCPADAVQVVKNISHLVLTKNGGMGCVREFIDEYLLKEPIK